MRVNSFGKLLACLSLTILFAACAQNGDSGSGSGGGGNTSKKPQVPADCNQAWDMVVRMEPKGRMTEYENKNYIKMESGKELTSHINVKTTVLESNSEHILRLVESEMLIPGGNEPTRSQEKLTKKEFLQFCNLGSDEPTNPMEEAQERTIGVESLMVKAGRFQTTHYESILNQNQNGMNMRTKTDSWIATDYEGLMIKSITESTSGMDGETYSTTFETELIGFKN